MALRSETAFREPFPWLRDELPFLLTLVPLGLTNWAGFFLMARRRRSWKWFFVGLCYLAAIPTSVILVELSNPSGPQTAEHPLLLGLGNGVLAASWFLGAAHGYRNRERRGDGAVTIRIHGVAAALEGSGIPAGSPPSPPPQTLVLKLPRKSRLDRLRWSPLPGLRLPAGLIVRLTVYSLMAMFVLSLVSAPNKPRDWKDGYYHVSYPPEAAASIRDGMPVVYRGRRIGEVVDHWDRGDHIFVVYKVDPRRPGPAGQATLWIRGVPGHSYLHMVPGRQSVDRRGRR